MVSDSAQEMVQDLVMDSGEAMEPVMVMGPESELEPGPVGPESVLVSEQVLELEPESSAVDKM